VLSPPGIDPFDVSATLPVDTKQAKTRGWASLWKLLSGRVPKWAFEVAEIFYNIPAWFRLRSHLRRKKYDLVLERYSSYLVVGMLAARRAGCLFVLEVNDVSGVSDRVRRQVFPKLCAFAERRLLQRSDCVHAVSSYLADRVAERGVSQERVVVAPNGFDLRRLRSTRSRDEMRARYGLDGSIVIGFAGWFVEWDRLDFMVEAFAEAQRNDRRLKLCLVGDGQPMSAVRQMMRELSIEDALIHTGAVPRGEVYDFIGMFDIGLLPHSNLFGSPMIMFEMMGLRVPIIAPRLPPIEDVHRDGSTALLFTPLDQRDCVRQLGRLGAEKELRESLAEAAFRILVEDHTWICTAERILAGLPRISPASD
jgi:glycosyltransferase involved in cell wall biosynthesis